MKETEVEILAGELDFNKLMAEIAGELSLPLINASEGKTTDHYIDTKSRKLLAAGASLRLREKLYPGKPSEYRLTVKFPVESHEILMVRDEVRLRIAGEDWRGILDFTADLALALTGESVVSQLILDEYYRQVSMGTPEAHLDVSFDDVAYVCPDNESVNAHEYVLEFEDHGIGPEAVLAAYEYVHGKFGWYADRRGKYRRGIELLGI
ncbi:MAG: CYTH domain-containing protein [bacterium]|jgi:hypothetical protein